MDIDAIKSKVGVGKYMVSFTHTEKLRQRMIEANEIEEAVCNGTITESYPDDTRGPSCLIMGLSNNGRPLHVVCGRLDEEEILIITAYEPDPVEWEPDFKTRKGS